MTDDRAVPKAEEAACSSSHNSMSRKEELGMLYLSLVLVTISLQSFHWALAFWQAVILYAAVPHHLNQSGLRTCTN
jgi:hypothetical protein